MNLIIKIALNVISYIIAIIWLNKKEALNVILFNIIVVLFLWHEFNQEDDIGCHLIYYHCYPISIIWVQ